MQQFDVDQLYLRLSSCETEEQRKETLSKLAAQDKKKLMVLWTESFKYPDYDQNILNLSEIVELLTSEELLAESSQWLGQQIEGGNLSNEWISNLAGYLEKTRTKPDSIIVSCCQLHKHKKEGGRFKESPNLLRGILKCFEFIEEDKIRQRVMLLVLELMLQNPQLVKQANQPYYCLEYFVYQLNQETDLPRALNLLKYLADINLLPHSEKLFTANDYRAIVDVLIRLAENSDDEQTLVSLVEFYLVLSLNPNISSQGKYYQIDRMIVAAAGLKGKSKLGQQLLMELYTMKMQSN